MDQVQHPLKGPCLILGGGATALSVARYLQRMQVPFALMEPDAERLPQLENSLEESGIRPEAVVATEVWPEQWLQWAESAIASPGIPPWHPMVEQVQRAGLKLYSDLDVFVQAVRKPDASGAQVVLVTGSNGKSTTVQLLSAMGRASGHCVHTGGNLMPPALDLLPQGDAAYEEAGSAIYILEVSSFQLEYSGALNADVAAVINLASDHMDRHLHMRRYGDIKRQIYSGARVAVFNLADPATIPPPWCKADRLCFNAQSDALAEPPDVQLSRFSVSDVMLCRNGLEWWPFSALGVRRQDTGQDTGKQDFALDFAMVPPGMAENAVAACTLAELLGFTPEAMLQALEEYTALPHRCQPIWGSEGIIWIDDSKATNPASSAAAIEAVFQAQRRRAPEGRLILIAGGQTKAAHLEVLRQALESRVDLVLLVGADAHLMEQAAEGVCPFERCGNLRRAVSRAAQQSTSGDVVLLSPAGASLDAFDSYADRGRQFFQAVQELAA